MTFPKYKYLNMVFSSFILTYISHDGILLLVHWIFFNDMDWKIHYKFFISYAALTYTVDIASESFQ